MTSRVVIVHPSMGIFLGSFWGLGFWSELDTIGMVVPITFDDEADATDFMRQMALPVDECRFVPVDLPPLEGLSETAAGHLAIEALKKAGLEEYLSDMPENLEKCLAVETAAHG